MKLLNEANQEKKFEPFDLSIRVETEDEARLLWHVFNRLNLTEAIFGETYGAEDEYIKPKIDDITSDEICDFISEKVRIEK